MRFLRRTDDFAGMPRPALLMLDLNLPRRSGLERAWGCRGRERICCRRRGDLSGRLAGGVLGLPSLAVLLAVAIGRAVPPDWAGDRSVRLSGPSVSTFTGAVMAFVVAATLLPQPGRAALGVGLLAVAVVLAGLFILVDRRSAAPLLPKAVLGERPLRQGAAGALLDRRSPWPPRPRRRCRQEFGPRY
jgi:hypothetical protein